MMKKIGIVLLLCVGFLLTANYAFAGDVEKIQGAQTETAYFDSIHVGTLEEGGVTYFNGSIVNGGENTPVTFGDDVRIDGMLWRGENSGIDDQMPLKVNDNLKVYGDLEVDKNITIEGNVSIGGNLDIGNSSINSHWLMADGIQGIYVLRVPHSQDSPENFSSDCNEGDLYMDTTAGSTALYGCDEENEWVAL
jgi:hypothetical protein